MELLLEMLDPSLSTLWARPAPPMPCDGDVMGKVRGKDGSCVGRLWRASRVGMVNVGIGSWTGIIMFMGDACSCIGEHVLLPYKLVDEDTDRPLSCSADGDVEVADGGMAGMAVVGKEGEGEEDDELSETAGSEEVELEDATALQNTQPASSTPGAQGSRRRQRWTHNNSRARQQRALEHC